MPTLTDLRVLQHRLRTETDLGEVGKLATAAAEALAVCEAALLSACQLHGQEPSCPDAVGNNRRWPDGGSTFDADCTWRPDRCPECWAGALLAEAAQKARRAPL